MALTLVRRRLLEFIAAVAVLHGIAIALYHGLDIERRSTATQQYYAWGWLALSAVVTLVGLRRFHRARRATNAAGVPPGARRGSTPRRP